MSNEKPRPRVEHHRGGTICAKGQTLNDQLHGYWEWYRTDGSLKRSGHFELGYQVGTWITYDVDGAPYKISEMKSKA